LGTAGTEQTFEKAAKNDTTARRSGSGRPFDCKFSQLQDYKILLKSVNI